MSFCFGLTPFNRPIKLVHKSKFLNIIFHNIYCSSILFDQFYDAKPFDVTVLVKFVMLYFC